MNRFFVPPENILGDMIYIKREDDIRHILKALRLNENEEIEVFDGVKWEYTCRITEISKKLISGKIIDRQAFSNEPVISISLYQGIPKNSKMDLVVEKSVELGVSKIIPFESTRTDVKNKDGLKNKVDRWNKIALSAACQSKRGVIPEVLSPINFEDMTLELPQYDLVIFCYEDEEDITLKDLLRGKENKDIKNICIIIGSEGGFSSDEKDQLSLSGIKAVSMGDRTLRTETAGIACISMVLYEMEL